MLDEMLFQRGHISTRIGDQKDDYDNIIPDHYFRHVMGLSGEVIDSEGSEYELNSLKNDNFVITFTAYGNVFQTDDGNMIGFEELSAECTGTVIQEDGCDVLRIDTFQAKVIQDY